MGFCILGGKENYLRKVISEKLTSLGEAIGMGASPAQFSDAIQQLADDEYDAGQSSVKTGTHRFSIRQTGTLPTQSYNTGLGDKLIGASVTGVGGLRFYSWQENFNAYTPGGIACNCANGTINVTFSGSPTCETNTSQSTTQVTIDVTYWYFDD